MGWSWQDEQDTPTEVLDVIVEMIREEQRAHERAARERR